MARTKAKKSSSTWRDDALIATRGTQFGAILVAAFCKPAAAGPRFGRKASITSDGYVMCDFVDANGNGHSGAFVGAVSDLERNTAGLARHLKLNPEEREELYSAVRGWIGQDWRTGKPGLKFPG